MMERSPTEFNYLRGNVPAPASGVDSRHGAGGGHEAQDGLGERAGASPPPVARAPSDEPAHPGRGGRGLLAPSELHRDRAGVAEPGDGPPSRPPARGAAARPERAAPRRGLCVSLALASARL